MEEMSHSELIALPIILPCGLTLLNSLVKCAIQETTATPPLYHPPTDMFRNQYNRGANARDGLMITGQIQIDIRYLSIKGNMVCHNDSMKEPYFSRWKGWPDGSAGRH